MPHSWSLIGCLRFVPVHFLGSRRKRKCQMTFFIEVLFLFSFNKPPTRSESRASSNSYLSLLFDISFVVFSSIATFLMKQELAHFTPLTLQPPFCPEEAQELYSPRSLIHFPLPTPLDCTPSPICPMLGLRMGGLALFFLYVPPLIISILKERFPIFQCGRPLAPLLMLPIRRAHRVFSGLLGGILSSLLCALLPL